MRIVCNILFLILISYQLVCAQSQDTKQIINNLDRYFQKAVDDWDVPGMTVGIVKDGKIIISSR